MTRTDLYLHAKSEHHPAQKWAVLTTLIRWAKTLCDPDSLVKEIQHLRDTFKEMDTARAKSDEHYTPNWSLNQRIINQQAQLYYHTNRPCPIKSADS
jgi:hypothetical protein